MHAIVAREVTGIDLPDAVLGEARALANRPGPGFVADHPDCGPLATELSIREDHFDDVPAHVAGCLETLDRKRAEAALREKIAQLKAAERDGRAEDARMLNVQVNELRMNKAGRPPAGMLSFVKE